ncbi:hypothetical protein AVEN_199752-1 [Araneus ventricosus]|uniref:Uncharacterized protein n=1 Tax=Araneus ventricosus TaxID=182803 RepID=A0A4Y2J8L4_ARAVE|nr:hypothetical protein AVEN_199752-1 [Araneus ventricosus]
MPNEPDGNSYPDEQMEMSPPLVANPTPIQIRDAIRNLGKLRNLVPMTMEYEEVTLTLEDGNSLSSEEEILQTLKEVINKWVSDITSFGICSLDNCNCKEIENKLKFEEAECKRNIVSSSRSNNVCSNSSVTSRDNVML